jgi:hypothetical protein
VFSVFNYSYIKNLVRSLKKELMIAAIITVVLYFLLMTFQQQWLFFSSTVSMILYNILAIFYPVTYEFTTAPILSVRDFAVAIGPPCSGIDSMLLFIAFFAALFALDHRRIKRTKFIILAIIGLVGVYVVNVIRLLLLIVIGVHISPEFAVGLFHTNAGWLFFLLYFLGYYLLIKKHIYK